METSNGLSNEKLKAIIQDWELDNEVTRLDPKYGIQSHNQAIRLEIRHLPQAILYFLTEILSVNWLFSLPDSGHAWKYYFRTGIHETLFLQHGDVVLRGAKANICFSQPFPRVSSSAIE